MLDSRNKSIVCSYNQIYHLDISFLIYIDKKCNTYMLSKPWFI